MSSLREGTVKEVANDANTSSSGKLSQIPFTGIHPVSDPTRVALPPLQILK